MANTSFAQLGQVSGSSWAAAFANNVQTLDIFQIVDFGGNILLNVDSTGVVHNPASSPTNGTNYGPYQTRLTSGTTAALFADAFSNPSNQDILQLISPGGGSILNYIDANGVSH